MKVSIIIPVYNSERYLKECLDSALAQTIKEKEILCINDGSTDNSFSILQEYAKYHKEIYILTQENKGAGEARNAGLDIAQGEFVCFLDSDDYYLDTTALNQMVQACKVHDTKVCGSFRKIKKNASDELQLFEMHREICKGNKEGVRIDYFDYQEDYHYQNYIFELDMIRKHNIRFPDYRRYQDPPFFLKAMLVAKTMWVLPIELYCLRLGHQNFKKYGKLIRYTLMGIRDNMELSNKNNLCKLQAKLIRRINNDFYIYIMENFNSEIAVLLFDIQKNILKKDSEQIKNLSDICNYYKLRDSYYELEKFHHELCSSYYIMRMIIETRYKGIRIGEYLNTIHIKNIAIYGMGTFGSALYSELKESKIKVICGIDRNKKCIENLQVIDDIHELLPCDAIIVTPLREGENIAEILRKIVKIPVYTLIEILNEIEEYM